MISFADALALIEQHCTAFGPRQASTDEWITSVIAEPIVAQHDSPLFSNSAMDGYGIKAADIKDASENSPVSLHLVGTIQAGDAPDINLSSGSAVRIFTGAAIPQGVDTVVMQEHCEAQDGNILLKRALKVGTNVRRAGEEFTNGSCIIDKGVYINPAVVGLLSTLGYASVPVIKKPRIAIITTGNELLPPGSVLGPAKIYDSNAPALAAVLQSMRLPYHIYARIADEPEILRKTISHALKESDVLITVGGVSVGDYDILKDIIEDEGIERIFWRVAIKPGKPFYFGVQPSGSEKKYVFGLPGNPVSAMVTFHQLVKPALASLLGLNKMNYPSQMLRAVLLEDMHKKEGRLEFSRGVLGIDRDRLTLRPARAQGSHMTAGLAGADCLIHFPLESEHLRAGDIVDAERLQWSLA